MKVMMNSKRHRRKYRSLQVGVVGTLTSVLLFGMLTAPVASAETVTVEAHASAGTAVAPANGDPSGVDASLAKISSEEAVARVKSLVPLLKDAQMNGVRLTNDRNNGGDGKNPVWEINWTIQRGNSSHGFSSDVNAVTGDVINLGIPYDLIGEPTYYPPKLSEAEALTVARDFIAKAVPSLGVRANQLERSNDYNGLSMTPLFGPVSYNFAFEVTHEGVKVQGQPISVTVNGNGDVTNFYFINNSTDYPSSKPKTTLVEAQKQFEKDLRLQLAYYPLNNVWKSAPDEWRLTYVPSVLLNLLDAQTGKWVDWDNKSIDMAKADTYIELQATGEPFKAHRVTAEEAIKSIVAYADIPQDYSVQSQQINKGQGDQHDTWYIRWSKENNFMMEGRGAQVDAETGQILSFNVDRYGPYPTAPSDQPKAVPLALDKAVKLADDWLLANIIDAKKYKRVEHPKSSVDETTGYVTINYQMFHKDIPVQNQNVGVTFDEKGRVVGIYAQTGIESYDALDNLTAAIKPEEAKATYLAVTEMHLNYVRSGGYNIAPSGQYIPVTQTLGYVPIDRENGNSMYRVVDAVSGKLIMPYEDPRAKQTTSAADTGSHWAKEYLQAALDHGVLVPDDNGKVNPDNSVTKGQFISMAALAINPYSENSSYYGGESSNPLYADVDDNSVYLRAVNDWIGLGWLKPDTKKKLLPDQQLTREQLAVYLSTMTGYSKFSDRLSKDKEVESLKDRKAITNPGAVALAIKLELMSAANGSFRPSAKVTVAEAAVALVRLANIQGSLDRPLSSQRYY